MYVVAIYNLKENKQDMAGALAAVLKVTAFEALTRLRAPGSGPIVVSVVPEKDQAEKLASQLESGGFSVLFLGNGEIEAEADRWLVRRFDFGDKDLKVESNEGKDVAIAYRDIDLILRGIGISGSTSTETTKRRKLDLASAVLSGGLKVMKTTKTVREVKREDREGFLALYAGDHQTLTFQENGLVYDALGPARGLSRSANFVQLTLELRRRCPAARYDERLLNKASQTALLGPLLSPDEHLVVATALLAKVMRRKM